MRTLTYYMAVSLDGYVAGPNGDTSGFLAEGDHMAFLFDEFADAMPSHVHGPVGIAPTGSTFDTVIMGWNTYAVGGIASPYAHLRQYVASRATRDVPDDITLTNDPVTTVRELKAESGDAGIYLAGAGQLAATLIDDIDQLILKVNPILLGQGIRLFAIAPFSWRDWKTARIEAFESGVTILWFDRNREARV